MKEYSRLIASLTLFFLLHHTASFAQTKRELQLKRDKLQKEINDAQKSLENLSKNKNVTLSQLKVLKDKITLREQLIGTINTEISTLGNEITKTGNDIKDLERSMVKLKAEYADMIKFAFLNQDRYQRLRFFFSSVDFNQAYKRIKYLQQINEFRRGQAALIEAMQDSLGHKKSDLEKHKIEKTNLRNNEVRQKKNLDKEKNDRDKLVIKLQDQEKKLRQTVAEKQKAKQKLESNIEKLVRREIESAKKKAAAAGKKNVTSGNVFSLTPEANKLSVTFAGNRGTLPWPVITGRISSSFGSHPHPSLKGVTIKNDGIDIEMPRGSIVRSVFQGEVSGTIFIPGSGSAVIVRHGEYISVYSNLRNVSVKKGDRLTTKQTIGMADKGENEDKAEINLQIWKGFSKLDPQLWLAKNP